MGVSYSYGECAGDLKMGRWGFAGNKDLLAKKSRMEKRIWAGIGSGRLGVAKATNS